MPTITNFAEAAEALRPYYKNATLLHNLDNMQRLMAAVGNPQDKLKVIHVAGTSGKTSTVYYCAALLRQQGLQVGMTASPHVDNINERLQINGVPLPEAEYCALLAEFMDIVAAADIKPSYFELLTALSYWQFAARGVDYAVIEVGMGGQLDATNVVTRADKVCIITDIGYDHTHILGKTLTSIAGFKAGIIQPRNQVFMYRQDQEVMDVVTAVVAEQQANLVALDKTAELPLPGLPLFQQRNLGLARQAVDYVAQRDGRPALTDEQVQAVAQITVPARLERFEVAGKTIFIDGSHNQQKLHAMLSSVAELYSDQDVAAVAGFVDGIDVRWQGGLDELLPAVQHLIFTGFYGEQDFQKTSINPTDLQAYAVEQGYSNTEIAATAEAALATLLERPEPLLILTGSFYLMHDIRSLIRERL